MEEQRGPIGLCRRLGCIRLFRPSECRYIVPLQCISHAPTNSNSVSEDLKER